MQGNRPILTQAPASEVQTSLTLVDFFTAWYQMRRWFLAGFILVALVTIVANKLFMTKFYRAEARIFVGRSIPVEQRIGISDLEAPPVGRNDQFINMVQGVLAEQYLNSTTLLLETARRLQKGEFASTGIKTNWNLYELLNITEADESMRERKLAYILQTNLIQVKQVQNSGVLLFSVELPDPVAAQNFTNACLRVLQERFTDLEFGYYDEAYKLYKKRLAQQTQESEKLAQSRVGLELDRYPTQAQKNDILKAELDHQATFIADLNKKVSILDLATTTTAKVAGQPLKIIDYAYPPLKKSRPQTIINTLMATALYTFVFMLGLVVFNYARWSVATTRRETKE